MAPAEDNERFDNDQLIEQTKAIYDQLKEEIPSIVDKHLKNYDDSSVITVAKVLAKQFDKQHDASLKHYDDRLYEQAKYYQGLLNDQAKQFDVKVKHLEKTHDKHIQEMKDFYELGLSQLISAVKGMPSPTVVIPENAIKSAMTAEFTFADKAFNVIVDQPPPVNNFYAPEKSIEVKMLPAKNVFEKGAIQVSPEVQVKANLEIPEGGFKSIVQIPPRTTTQTKSILYDQTTGRPSEIVEKTEEK